MPRHTLINHRAAAAAAKDNLGVIVAVGTCPSRGVARNTALRIPHNERAPAYLPAGAYEPYAAQHEDGGTIVWACYVQGLPELEPPRTPGRTRCATDLIAVQRATTRQWPFPELTEEEQRYAEREMTAGGWSTQAIADRLGVADRTVTRRRGGGS